jgi:uncharacterized membrane protein
MREMNPVVWIGLWAALFVVTHLGMTASSIRPRLVARLGDWPYVGLYSLVSLATFIPLVVEFSLHKHAGATLWNLREVPVARLFAIILMVACILIAAASVVAPSPASIAAQGRSVSRPHGILKFTRHPLFVAISLFAIAHMLMNGELVDLVFFGSLLVLCVVGISHQDSRKLRQLGEPYGKFCAATSAFPGLALLSGRQRWRADDFSWPALALGTLLIVVLIALHPLLFGGHPLG